MRNNQRISVIIPALDEEQALGHVLSAIPAWVDEVIVADNGSTDRTSEVARAHGARVVREPARGYGSACLAGMAALDRPDVVVFVDGDNSDYPEEMALLVDPIVQNRADMVIGSRVLGEHEPGALTPQARFGNWLSCRLIRLFWGVRYTDLGPFRAIRYSSLRALRMADRDYGWTVEMQIKAARQGLRCLEVPVRYRHRIGQSKISRTIRGSIAAGRKILWTIGKAAMQPRHAAATAQDEALIVFTRWPEPGRAKTRLIPALGPEGAADLHRRLAEHCIRIVRGRQPGAAAACVRFEGGDAERMAAWLGPGLTFMPQGPGDLGERMARAFREAFEAGAARVVTIGTDCPQITPAILARAYDALREHDLVLGPATDGGYYLIGLRRHVPGLFEGVAWSTDKVLAETLRRARDLGLSHALLPQLSDVDRPEDLTVWQQVAQEQERDATEAARS